MRTGSLCLLVLVQSCAANEPPPAASMAVAGDSELEECTELLRGLLLTTETLESESAKSDARCAAKVNILNRQREAAEARASRSEWSARWGAPIGLVGGATAGALFTALLFLMFVPQGR